MNLKTIIVTAFKNAVWTKSAKASYQSRVRKNHTLSLKSISIKKGN